MDRYIDTSMDIYISMGAKDGDDEDDDDDDDDGDDMIRSIDR